MALDLAPLVEQFEEFFSSTYAEKINDLAEAYPEKRSLEIDYSDLERFSPQLADELLDNPDVLIKAAEEALKNTPTVVMSDVAFEPHARFRNLPSTAEVLVQDVGADYIGKLVAIAIGICSIMTRKERLLNSGGLSRIKDTR